MKSPISQLLPGKKANIFSVSPDATVASAVNLMNMQRIGSVLVMENRELAGIFTERDVLTRVVGKELDPKTTPVRNVMTSDPVKVKAEDTIEQVMAVISAKRVRHLPVFEKEKLLGVVSSGDITRHISNLATNEADALKSYIAGGYPG